MQSYVTALSAGHVSLECTSRPYGLLMAKPNYSFEKRQREIAKKKKLEEKEAKKRAQREAAKNSDAPKAD